MNSGHFIFGAIRRPVAVIGGDNIGLRYGVVERGINDAGRNAVGDCRPQGRLACTARQFNPVARFDTAILGIYGMDFQQVFGMPDDIFRPPRLRADIVM